MRHHTTSQVRHAAVAVGLVAVAGFGASCHGARTPAVERVARAQEGHGDIVVAVAWPWATRQEVRYGEGLQMAVDEINQSGGVNGRRIRLLREDDKESVDEGELVAQRLADNPDVVAVIGHLQSYVTVPAAAIYDLSGLVLIAPTATDPELTAHGYTHVFRATFTDRTVGQAMAEFAARRGYKRIGIYYIRSNYGRNLANAFEERANDLGLSIPVRRSYDPGDSSSDRAAGLALRAWAGLDLDVVFLAGEVPSAARIIAEARKQGLTLPILGGDAMSSKELISVGGPAAEGTVVATAFHPDEPRPEVRRFVTAFEKRYGVPPDAGSALGYDAVRLLAHAMGQAHSTVPDRVAVALHALRDWPGVTGPFTFDSAGDLVARPIAKMVVQDGKFAYLPDSATGPVFAQRAIRPRGARQ